MASAMGYIEIRDGRASFHRIRGPIVPWAIPIVLAAATAVRIARRRAVTFRSLERADHGRVGYAPASGSGASLEPTARTARNRLFARR
jgi:hypothetical protein